MLRIAFSILRFSFVLTLLFAASFQSFVSVAVGESSEDEAASSLVDAGGQVTMAYLAVVKAEEAGANATDLLDLLNEAGVFLVQARTAFRLGDFDEAINFAALSESIAVEVQGDAVRLKNSTLGEDLQRKVLTINGSIIGVALVVFISIWCWHIFKRRYFRRVLTMKPGVGSDES